MNAVVVLAVLAAAQSPEWVSGLKYDWPKRDLRDWQTFVQFEIGKCYGQWPARYSWASQYMRFLKAPDEIDAVATPHYPTSAYYWPTKTSGIYPHPLDYAPFNRVSASGALYLKPEYYEHCRNHAYHDALRFWQSVAAYRR